MAETAGVTQTPQGGARGGGTGGGKIAPFMKKNKLLVWGGAGLAALLIMARRGKSAGGSTASSGDQLQAASDYLAASNAAQNAALADPSLLPGGVAPVDTGGGSFTSQGPTSNLAPGPTTVGGVSITPAPIQVNVVPGPQAGTPPSKAPTARPAVGSPAGPHGAVHAPSGAHKPPPRPGFRIVGTGGGGWIYVPTGNRPPARPSQPHPTRPAPARRTGKHPNTERRTQAGHRRASPVEVEAMIGAGAGVIINSRHFPGAQGYRMGPPIRYPGGKVSRLCTIDYGGHTERHMVHGNGDYWTDNVKGVSPPHERGVEQVLPGRNNAVK